MTLDVRVILGGGILLPPLLSKSEVLSSKYAGCNSFILPIASCILLTSTVLDFRGAPVAGFSSKLVDQRARACANEDGE